MCDSDKVKINSDKVFTYEKHFKPEDIALTKYCPCYVCLFFLINFVVPGL